jgi:hypothetical protein
VVLIHVGIHIEISFSITVMRFLNCKLGDLPFIYLGLLVRANRRLEQTWKPVIEVFQSRLHSWQNRYVSLDGMVVLINSVLALYSYFLYVFLENAD